MARDGKADGDHAEALLLSAALAPMIDPVFAAPLKEFVAERGRAARALKTAGRAAEAKEVARLPRPSIPVWATNQLALRQPALVARLIEATELLRRAQQDVLGEKESRPRYAQSTAAHREALAKLRDAAAELLASSGHAAAPATIDRVMRNLRAGASSDEQRPLLERGRLLTDVDEPDVSALMGTLVSPAPSARPRAESAPPVAPAPPPAQPAADQRRRAAEEAARAAAAREQAHRQAQEAEARKKEEARARAEADREVSARRAEATAARRALDTAVAARETARRALADAEAKAESAKGAAEEAARRAEAAEAARRALPDG